MFIVCKSQFYINLSDDFKIVLAEGEGDIILSSINPSIHFFPQTGLAPASVVNTENIISWAVTRCKNSLEDGGAVNMSRAGYESYKEFTAGQGEAGPAESINQASVLLTLISLQIPLLTTIEMTTMHCEMLLTLR